MRAAVQRAGAERDGQRWRVAYARRVRERIDLSRRSRGLESRRPARYPDEGEH
jgi:hypothetical protein